MNEIQKDIGIYNGIDYTGLYQVSNIGRVRSMDRYVNSCGGSLSLRKGTIIVPFVASQYDRVHLNKDGKRKIASVHRLVAIAFVENPCPEKFKEVNHIDEDKTNNNANNLEWCDRSYNQKYYAERHPEEKVKNFHWEKHNYQRRTKHKCPICGKITYNKECCSPECRIKKAQRVDRPDRQKLKEMIRTMSFLTISKTYGVTDNTVRKWCKGYGLPYRSSDIKSFSDKEFEEL